MEYLKHIIGRSNFWEKPMKETVLLISRTRSWVCDILDTQYEFAYATSIDDGLAELEKNYLFINAILIDTCFDYDQIISFLDTIGAEIKYERIPAVLIVKNTPTDDDIETLDHGAIDFLCPGSKPKLTQHIVANAIRIKDSTTYKNLEHMLEALPSLIYLKDSEGRYIFSTHYWHHLEHGDDPNWTIRGKTDAEIRKDQGNAEEAMEADKEILTTGKGTRYMIKINVDDKLEYYDITKQPTHNPEGKINGIIGLINDITEQELLRKNLVEASITDGFTGLYNRSEIQRRISEALRDVGSVPFSLIMLDLDDFKRVNDTFGHHEGDIIIQSLSKTLLNECKMRGGDSCAGRWGGEEFMLLLPGIPALEAGQIAEEIRHCFEKTGFPNVGPQTTSLGVTEAKMDDTLDSLCSRVDHALYAAKAAGKNQVHTL